MSPWEKRLLELAILLIVLGFVIAIVNMAIPSSA